MRLPGGLGDGEWVILIKAYCLLPLVYWDAAKQRGTRTSLVKSDCCCRNDLEDSCTFAGNEKILHLCLWSKFRGRVEDLREEREMTTTVRTNLI